jgi:putative PIN family toxin of toxin-antitoxin system
MKKSKALKLIIDTNLWVSFIISKKQHSIDPLLYSEGARLLFSKELIAEINQTIKKPKLKKYFGTNALEEMLFAFDPFIDFIEVKSVVTLCRDAKDNFLLALAKDGEANYLLTGDKDLLDLKSFGKTRISTISEFISTTKNYH